MDVKKIFKYVMFFIRYCSMYFVFILLESLCANILRGGYEATVNRHGSIVYDSDIVTAAVIDIIVAVVLAYSVFRTFAIHDKWAKEEFANKQTSENYFAILASTVCTKGFLFPLVITVPLSLVFGCGTIFDKYFTIGGDALHSAVGTLLMCVLFLWARCGANVYIYDVKNQSEPYEAVGRGKSLAKDLVLICVIYPVSSALFFTAYKIVCSLIGILAVIPPKYSVTALVLLFVLPLVFFLIRAFTVRRKLFGELQRVCREMRFKLSDIHRPYASLFFHKDEVNFTVTANGKKYCCGFISCLYKDSDIYFMSDGNYIQKYPVSLLGRFVLFQFQRQHRYGFEADGNKIIIASPVPYNAYIIDGGTVSKTHSDAKLWGYRLFSSTEFVLFLGADKL